MCYLLFFEKVELVILEDLGGGGGDYSNIPQYTCALQYVIAIYTLLCNMYYIFVHVYKISLVVICFMQIFLYHRGYYILNVH